MNYVCFVLFLYFAPFYLSSKVGGPDRPVLEKGPERVTGGTSKEGVTGTAASAASNLAASAVAVQSSVYDKLSSAMNERG